MIFDRIKSVIVETISCDAEEVKPEAKLIDDLGADSLDAVELNMALEDEFDIQIADEELAKMITVADIARYVEGKIK